MVLPDLAALGREDQPRGVKAWLHATVGNSHHKWMWDYASLATALEQAGFSGIRRASFGDAADPRFADVEEEGRWEGCLGIECQR